MLENAFFPVILIEKLSEEVDLTVENVTELKRLLNAFRSSSVEKKLRPNNEACV